MTKKNPPIQQETLNPPTIPINLIGIRDAWVSGFITGCLKNRKRGAPLKIAPLTITIKKKKGKKTSESPSVAAIVSPVTASTAVTSATNAANTASTNGEATAPPSKYKRSRKHSGDASKNTRAPYSKLAPKLTTRKRKYNNWKLEPFKSALDRAVGEQLKGLDPQLASGYIIIPGGLFEIVLNLLRKKQRSWGCRHCFI